VIARKTSQAAADNVINFLAISPYTIEVDIHFTFGLIAADLSDNKFVDCAITANADHLLSNDKLFQILKNISFPSVPIIDLRESE